MVVVIVPLRDRSSWLSELGSLKGSWCSVEHGRALILGSSRTLVSAGRRLPFGDGFV